MSEPLTLHVPNTIDAIAPANEAAETWLAKQDASLDATFFTCLAIEEIVTNCIKYGYDDSDEHTILIVLSVADARLTIVVIDDGHAFDPLAEAPPDLSLALEDRQTGGLGIHLLRKLSDDISYERINGTNRLTLSKRMS